jgi:hypothetical protein
MHSVAAKVGSQTPCSSPFLDSWAYQRYGFSNFAGLTFVSCSQFPIRATKLSFSATTEEHEKSREIPILF